MQSTVVVDCLTSELVEGDLLVGFLVGGHLESSLERDRYVVSDRTERGSACCVSDTYDGPVSNSVRAVRVRRRLKIEMANPALASGLAALLGSL